MARTWQTGRSLADRFPLANPWTTIQDLDVAYHLVLPYSDKSFQLGLPLVILLNGLSAFRHHIIMACLMTNARPVSSCQRRSLSRVSSLLYGV